MTGFMKRPNGSARPNSENPPIIALDNRVKDAVSLLDQLAPNMLFINKGLYAYISRALGFLKLISWGTSTKVKVLISLSATQTAKGLYNKSPKAVGSL